MKTIQTIAALTVGLALTGPASAQGYGLNPGATIKVGVGVMQ